MGSSKLDLRTSETRRNSGRGEPAAVPPFPGEAQSCTEKRREADSPPMMTFYMKSGASQMSTNGVSVGNIDEEDGSVSKARGGSASEDGNFVVFDLSLSPIYCTVLLYSPGPKAHTAVR